MRSSCLFQVVCEEEVSLRNHQEEADTKVFLCSQHAVTWHGATSVCIHTVDSDIAIYSLFFSKKINVELFVKIGIKDRTRIIAVSDIAVELGEDCCLALPALHAFTGNDYTSAFHGVGNAKALKVN